MRDTHFDELIASRRALLLGLAAVVAAPLAGCAGDGDVPAPPVADGVALNQPAGVAPLGATAEGLAAFGHRIVSVAGQPGRNFVASPLSLALAFSMVRAGASGATASELDAVFGFPPGGRDAAYNAIMRQLATVEIPPEPDGRERSADQEPKPPVVSIGNALFPQKGLEIGAQFLKTLAAEYGAGVLPVDFAGGDALKMINAWAERQTAGRIKKVFEQLDANTTLVLANAVYFKANWHTHFTPVGAKPFTKADGTVISAQGMWRVGPAPYAEVDGMKAVELPYAAGEYAMWLMLPPVDGKPEEALTPATLGKLRAAFALANQTQTAPSVGITVPKWDFETSLNLVSLLRGLGLRTAFGPGADFSGIAKGLFISQAVHKANISVDEWGTEAAAVTSIAMNFSAPLSPEVRFTADRPFAFAIVGGTDRIPLFMGRVSDPQ